jgi:hypothetical protein
MNNKIIESIAKVITNEFEPKLTYGQVVHILLEKENEIKIPPVVNRVVTGRNCAEVSFNNDDFTVLFSYDMPVAAVLDRSKPASERLHCSINIMGCTNTTRKHIKEFFTIYGFRDILPVETNEKELMELVAGK